MSDVWLKIKAWTKGILFGIALVYAVLFVYNNSGAPVRFWWWFGHSREIDAFFLTIGSFLAGCVCTLLVGTTLRTVRQIRDVRTGMRQDRLERELDVIKAKAATLHARPDAAAPGDGVTIRVDDLGSPR